MDSTFAYLAGIAFWINGFYIDSIVITLDELGIAASCNSMSHIFGLIPTLCLYEFMYAIFVVW